MRQGGQGEREPDGREAGRGVSVRYGLARFQRFPLPPVARGLRLRMRLGAILSAIASDVRHERDERRFFLWAPVVFALGIVGYFALPREPLLVALLPTAMVLSAAALWAWWRGRAILALTIAALISCGALSAKLRVDRLSGPVIATAITTDVTGRVVAAEPRVDLRPRMTLDRLVVDRLDDAATPRRIRVSVARSTPLPEPGATISGRMRLMPVPGPAAPGDYDPRRAAFFDGIGGSAILFGQWEAADGAPGAGWATIIARLRSAIAARIRAAEPGPAGAIAAALLVGERSAIPHDVAENLRVAGLAHILAISGLHMGLFAGTLFFAVRAGLAAVPAIALTRPVRKWAAAAALAAGLVYLVLSGNSVATVRAYVMAAVMFGAILIDRPALSMRNLAIAAFVVMLAAPESVVEPGFQMSFFAVAGLIAVWEAWRIRRDRTASLAEPGPIARIARRLGGAIFAIALTTFVAGLATAPIAAFHFQRIAVYSLAGNLLAMPLVSLVVMPAGLAALILMPFGLESLPLAAMTTGIEAVLAIAERVATLSGAVRHVAAPHPATLALVLAGLLWLCLWQTRIRLAGIALVVTGIASAAPMAERPTVRINSAGTIVAVSGPDGSPRVSGGRAGAYVLERWQQRAGLDPVERPDRTGVACDPLGCVLSGAGDLTVAHVRDPFALAEDCLLADLVITPLPAPAQCAAPIIAAGNLAARGAHALTITGNDENGRPIFAVETAYPAVRRPWQLP